MLVEELATLRMNYASLLHRYKKELKSSRKAQKTLIEILSGLDHSDVADFDSSYCTLKNEKSSLFNTFYLKKFCDSFPGKVR